MIFNVYSTFYVLIIFAVCPQKVLWFYMSTTTLRKCFVQHRFDIYVLYLYNVQLNNVLVSCTDYLE